MEEAASGARGGCFYQGKKGRAGADVEELKPLNAMEELLDKAKMSAVEIASKSSHAIVLAKRSHDEGFEMNLCGALHYEIECFAQCFSTEDHRKGWEVSI